MNEYIYWRNAGVCVWVVYHYNLFAPGNKINSHTQRIWTVMDDIYDILYRMRIMGTVWRIFGFFPNHTV